MNAARPKKRPDPPFGVLNVFKPAGMTSRDVVNRLERAVPGVRFGHAGTLDPLAEGVLVVCVGPATRLIEFVQQMPKTYLGTFLLGRTSDTEDVEGNVVELPADAPRPTREQLEAVLPRFVGRIEQRPPAFSALKVHGRRAYQLARRGEDVKLPVREIDVYSVKLIAYGYPTLELEIECGSGTYVRSLGRDVAEALGTGAVMSGLRRTAIGEYRDSEACRLDRLTAEAVLEHLLPSTTAVARLPQVRLTDEAVAEIHNGRNIPNEWGFVDERIAAIDASGGLAAILVARDAKRLRPLRNFPATGRR